MEDFQEKSFGDAEGMTYEEIRNAFPDSRYTNEEEECALTERVSAGVEKVRQQFSDKKVLLVAHGAVINSIFDYLTEGKKGYRRAKLQNGCLSQIYYHENCWKIHSFNEGGHLLMHEQTKD